ncbi:MAG: hypothetical protein MZV49_04020 [Rhodopseudomonas palustris]|nr:hypothetical protein [Rhodopseudomonas palustris]
MPTPARRMIRTNAEAPAAVLEEVARSSTTPGRRCCAKRRETMQLSARGYHRVLRVARTLADLDGAAAVSRRASGRSAVLPGAGRGFSARGVTRPVIAATAARHSRPARL